jgi:hypothetical protein
VSGAAVYRRAFKTGAYIKMNPPPVDSFTRMIYFEIPILRFNYPMTAHKHTLELAQDLIMAGIAMRYRTGRPGRGMAGHNTVIPMSEVKRS